MTDISDRDVELLNHFRAEIRFENGLASDRQATLISSQSFLVIAYAASMASLRDNWGDTLTLLLPPFLALLGLLLSLTAWPGIRASQGVLERWRAKENELLQAQPALAKRTLASDELGRADLLRRRYESALFAKRAPLIFIAAWCWFLALPIFLYVTD